MKARMDQAATTLSEQARAILELIAAGRSYDQILLRFPELSYQDIFAAAGEALAKLQAGTDRTAGIAHAVGSEAAATSPDTAPDGGSLPASAERPPSESASPKRFPSYIERARQTHHRAWARWTPDEDVQLAGMFRRGAHFAEIGQALGRHNGAIRSRLAKLGLVGEGDDAPELLLKPADAPSPPNTAAHAPPPPRASFEWEAIRQRLEGRQEQD
jgi:hypothetical protein